MTAPTRDDMQPKEPASAAAIRALVEEYAESLRTGTGADRYTFLRGHPELAAALEPLLDAAEALFTLGQSTMSAEAAQADWLAAPPFIGRYRIEATLGRGASSVVYRAFDPKHERQVALKVFAGRVTAASNGPDRFRRDALIAARLRHPNIVPLHDTGDHDGLRYIDMELVEGATLEQRLQHDNRPWAPRDAAALVRAIALALDYAHRQGVVHRDVKPSNILLDADGNPQLTDFDLAREVGVLSVTVQGQLLGTPSYMSPEQADGRAHDADARSDVYSLGVVLYRLITGRLPFEQTGSLTGLLTAIAQADPMRPLLLQPSVPRDLERICLKALEKAPTDRFATAEGLAEELGRFLSDEPLRFRPPSGWERLRRWVRRNRATAALIAVAGLLVATIAILSWAEYRRSFEAAVRARLEDENEGLRGGMAAEVERTLLRNAELRLRVARAGRRQEAQQLLRDAARARLRYGGGALSEKTRRTIRSLFALSLAFPDMAHYESADLPNDEFVLWPIALHPDGDCMVIGTPTAFMTWQRGTKLVVPPALKTALNRKERCQPWFSADGRWLVLTRAEGGLSVYDAAALDRLCASRGGTRVLAAAVMDNAVVACDVKGIVTPYTLPRLTPGTPWQIADAERAELSVASVCAKTGQVAIGTNKGQVAWYRPGGERLGAAAAARSSVDALCWSPDGQALAIGTRDGIVQLWDAAGKPGHRFHFSSAGVGRLCFSPDGRYLFAGQRFTYGRGWDLLTGQEVLAGAVAPAAFARHGRQVACGGTDQIAFATWLPSEGLEHLSGHHGLVGCTAWSRDSRRLASVDGDGEVIVWDLATHRPVRRLGNAPPGFYSENLGLALSDDGKLLAYAPGGPRATLSVQEVDSGRLLARKDLREGFDRLACTGGSRFLSLCDERPPGTLATHTVMRSITGTELSAPTILRQPRPGDEGFYELNVTADAKRACWIGPRSPTDQIHVEVFDLDPYRLVYTASVCPRPRPAHYSARLTHDGRYLWYTEHNGDRADDDIVRVDLDTGRREVVAFLPVTDCHGALIRRGKTFLARDSNGLMLQYGLDAAPWLELLNADGDPITPNSIRFDAQGRRLCWGCRNGTVTVADLDVLRTRIEAFEQTLTEP